jgi:hypothetical protein
LDIPPPGVEQLEISEKFCPVCKNKNDRLALVCIHCGAALEESLRGPTVTAMSTEAPSHERSGFDASITIEDSLIPANGIAIYVAGIDKRVSVSIEEELVFGRKVQGSNEPMLDLSELGGFQMGISRRHAKIRRAGNGYELIDLSSTNGTWLNNERLTPEKPYPLANGSQVQLGRMRLYLFHRTGSDGKKP